MVTECVREALVLACDLWSDLKLVAGNTGRRKRSESLLIESELIVAPLK
jgi:hypothetical protein